MTDRVYNVLFLSTGNSARSIMAESCGGAALALAWFAVQSPSVALPVQEADGPDCDP